MEQAIKLTKVQGYDDRVTDSSGNAFYGKKKHAEIREDPLFWQALIKKEGVFAGKAYWLWGWHDFIDHLAEGKDADSFFNKLLNP